MPLQRRVQAFFGSLIVKSGARASSPVRMWPAYWKALYLEQRNPDYRGLTTDQRKWCQAVWGHGWADADKGTDVVKKRKQVCKKAFESSPPPQPRRVRPPG